MDINGLTALFNKKEQHTYLVAIDGGGGAGKSTLARALQQSLGSGAVIVHADDFYALSSRRSSEIGGGWDLKRLEEQVLKPLSQNKPARYERYDWETDQLAEAHDVPAGGVVIVEGCYTMVRSLLPYYHFKIWVESPEELRLERGIERDGEEKRHLWEELWMPAEKVYMREQNPAGSADVVVSGTGGDDLTILSARN
ncbi:zeta toxin family protein [Domibacillus sp.]|uniref:uridine kinase family protein n=1 Tax=Domibacillus sp. TaxID=1969783 RepID=UPI0028118549|nr:AAA family ATPase [Domibacillus sp.]